MDRGLYPDSIRRNYDPDFKERQVAERRLVRHSEQEKPLSLKQPNGHTFEADRCCTSAADCGAVNKGVVPPAPVSDQYYRQASVPNSLRGPIQDGELVGQVSFDHMSRHMILLSLL